MRRKSELRAPPRGTSASTAVRCSPLGLEGWNVGRAGDPRGQVETSYNPPGAALGHVVASLFGADPLTEMDEDLMRMKSFLESPRGFSDEVRELRRGAFPAEDLNRANYARSILAYPPLLPLNRSAMIATAQAAALPPSLAAAPAKKAANHRSAESNAK
jgi:hypothetical protein